MRNLHLLACLVLSGFAGLAYELLWVRLLALGFGSTTLSFSTVLAVFFGGLALGAWLGGRWAPRLARPVRLYAWIEIATGVLALVLYPAIANIGPFFALIDPGVGLAGGTLRALVAIPLLLGPTLLMGATLPVVTRALVVDDEAVGSGSALIYGFNTLGAFLGTYVVTYLFIPELGVFASTLVTVAVNFVVGGLALAFEDRRPLPIPTQDHPESDDDVPDKIRWVAGGLAFTAGFSAICFQVVWVRLFSIFLDGTVYGVGSVLIAVLVGIGLGSLVIARPLRRSRNPGLGLVAMQIVLLVSITGLTAGLPWLSYTLRSLPDAIGGLAGLHAQLAVVFIALFLPSLASGASFPILMAVVEHRATRAGRSLGRLYAANTVGSISGSLLAGFVLIPYTGTVATLFLGLVGVGLIGALGAVFLSRLRGPLRLLLAAVPLALVASWGGFDVQLISMGGQGTETKASYVEYLERLKERKRSLVFFSEGRAATVAVRETETARSLSLNGLGQGSRLVAPPHHLYESLMVALVPMAHIDRVDRALVVGLGAGVTVDALRALGAERVDVVELEPAVVEGIEHIFPDESSPLRDPQVHVEIGDARHRLLIEARRGREGYDVITSMPAHPWVASSIFTREFFELAKANLSDEGVFSTWFGLGRMDAASVDSLTRAFALTFDHYVIYWVRGAMALYLVGSRRPLTVDVERFAELRSFPLVRLQRSIESDLHLAAQVVATGRPGDPPPVPGVVNTDDSAYVETRAPRTSSVASGVSDILPHPYLRSDFLAPEEDRARHALAVLERQLGTPEGRLALRPRPALPERVKATLDGVQDVLDPATVTYLRGRIALLEGQDDEARALFERVEAPVLAPRVRRFLPFTFPSGPERVRALRAAPPAGDVWLSRLAEDREGVLSELPPEPPRFEADRYGWLAWHGLTATSTLGAAGRARFAELGRSLAEVRSVETLELARDLALRNGWIPESRALDRALTTRRRARAGALYRKGRQAGARGGFAEAARHLEDAIETDGSFGRAHELLLIALVELGRAERLRELEIEMRYIGYPPERFSYLVKQARTRALAAEAWSEPADGAEGEEDGSGRGDDRAEPGDHVVEPGSSRSVEP